MRRYVGRGVVALGVAAMVSGCAVPTAPSPPPLDLPPRYSGGDNAACAAPQRSATDLDGWWRGFDAPALDPLVRSALAGAPAMAAQAERVAEARALTRAARAALFPRLDLGVSAGTQRRLAGSSGSSRGADVGGDVDDGRASVELGFGWTPDLWGEARGGQRAADAQVRRQQALADALARQTAADVARGYLTWRGAGLRLALLEGAVQATARTEQIVLARRRAGLAGALDEQRARADAAVARAQVETVRRAQVQARHALAVLSGTFPDRFQLAEPRQPAVPAWQGPDESSLSLSGLRCRPDLVAAEAEVQRAAAEAGVAAARLMPRLSLPGSLAATASGLGSAGARGVVAALSAVLDLPLFDAGERQALQDAAHARFRAAVQAHRETALAAAGDVEDVLVALQSLDTALQARRDAAAASTQALEQARVLYREGLVPLLDVLDAQRNLLSNQQALAEAQVARALATVDLHEALGVLQRSGTPPSKPPVTQRVPS